MASLWATSIRHVVSYGLVFLALLVGTGLWRWHVAGVPDRGPPRYQPRPLVSRGIPEPALTIEPVTSTMDVAPYFADPDGVGLTYATVSSGVDVVSASVSGSTLTLTPVSAGAVVVSVMATDTGGLTATQQIPVTVVGDDPVAHHALT